MEEEQEEVARSWLQQEKTQALGAEVTALPYFTVAKWAFLNLLKSKDQEAFLIWAPAARERTVPVGRHWHKHLLTAWDGVCVFWFSFLIIFLQSIHGPPSGSLWIVDCPWAPRCNAELSYLWTWAALEALKMKDLCPITYILWNNCLCLKHFDIDKWLKWNLWFLSSRTCLVLNYPPSLNSFPV